MHLKDLKKTPPAELVQMAEELEVEGASTLRRQDLMFAILKEMAEDGEEILGIGTIEVLPDGFGFLRSPEANYLAGPDDIYVSPNQVRKWGLRTGDTVEGEVRAPKDGERYFSITRLIKVNFDEPDAVRVEEHDEGGMTVLELHVAPDDVGKVIGRQGRIARALRTLVRASAARTHERVHLDIVD